MKFIVIMAFVLVSSLFANIECVDLDKYGYGNLTSDEARINLYNTIKQEIFSKVKGQCISDGGPGSTFIMETPLFVQTCLGQSESKSGYLKFQFGCDYCTSDRVTNLIEKNKKECNEACMESIAYCQSPDLIYEGGWGRILYISTRVI